MYIMWRVCTDGYTCIDTHRRMHVGYPFCSKYGESV